MQQLWLNGVNFPLFRRESKEVDDTFMDFNEETEKYFEWTDTDKYVLLVNNKHKATVILDEFFSRQNGEEPFENEIDTMNWLTPKRHVEMIEAIKKGNVTINVVHVIGTTSDLYISEYQKFDCIDDYLKTIETKHVEKDE